ncbi:Putative PA domain, peptidase M28 [Septoria linicola]|uniref:Peptide hydrolase n=1 Tax=Septoria linicola TaxID=215465 RepID=A0A9Q9ASU4_9PEZI|nr:Putative PA domain, peptidase M28 [Septoria linicola]
MVRSSLFLAYTALAAFASAHNSPLEARQEEASIASDDARNGGPKGGPKGKPNVDSKKLQDAIKESALKKKARELEKAAYSTPERNRVFGSPGHENTLKFIEKYLGDEDDYWTFSRQAFTELYSQGSGTFSAGGVSYPLGVFTYSSSTSGTLTAPIIEVANVGCDAADYPADVRGAIALISRGTCPFSQKSTLAKAAGAAGAVVTNNASGSLAGTLGGTGDYVPTGGVSQENGTAIRAALPLQGQLQITSVVENRTTYNIIADSKTGDKNNVVVIGAHSDSVFAGPGINDDGSGTIGILETAIQLAKKKYRLKNALRLGFWSAEEFGLLGSEYYVANLPQEERNKIKLYLNFDMIASPNWQYALYDGDGSAFNQSGPPGSDKIEHFFQDWFKARGIPTKDSEFNGRSDYGPFIAEGVDIPAGGIFTGAEAVKTEQEAAWWGGQAGVAYDPNYHLVGDNYNNLAFEPFLINTKAIAASVAKYTMDTSDIPARASGAKIKTRGDDHHPHGKRNTVKHSHQPGLQCGAEERVSE